MRRNWFLRPARRVLLRDASEETDSCMEIAVGRARRREGVIEKVEGAGPPHSLHLKDEGIGGCGLSSLAPLEGTKRLEGAVRPHSLRLRDKEIGGCGSSSLAPLKGQGEENHNWRQTRSNKSKGLFQKTRERQSARIQSVCLYTSKPASA